MIKLVFIRHGKTLGNMQSRYIGTTDEELCKEGINGIRSNAGVYPVADIVFTSPMKRCIQTAEIIYPGIDGRLYVIEEFKEIDFGEFEGKNYLELNGKKEYQEWIDSGGKACFPNGEDRKAFSERCINGFSRALQICQKLQADGNLKENAIVAFIVHGGTIMSVMEAFAEGQEEGDSSIDRYFNYQCGNGHGYICGLNIETGSNKLNILKEF